MSDQFSVTLSEHASHWVQWYAQMTGRSTSQVIGETVEDTLAPLTDAIGSLSRWSDDEVRKAADSSMPPQVEARLRELRDKQDEGTLSPSDQEDLDAITKLCQVENVRKARALAEAVRRGLRGPLS